MNYETCPSCKGILEDDGTCSCGYGVKRKSASGKVSNNPYRYGIQTDTASRSGDQQEKYAWSDKQCAWNDHGMRCERYGNISPSTNGHSPWYCSQHYSDYMGWTGKKLTTQEKEDGKEVIDFIRKLTLRKTSSKQSGDVIAVDV